MIFFNKKINTKNVLRTIFLGIGISLFFNTIIDLLKIKILFNFDESFNNTIKAYPKYFSIIIVCIIYPLIEELVFRKLIYSFSRKKLNIFFSIMLSAIPFAIFHGNFPQMIYALFAGIIFCLVYEWEELFIFPLICHLSANAATLFLYNDVSSFDTKQKLFVGLIGLAVILFSMILIYRNYELSNKRELSNEIN